MSDLTSLSPAASAANAPVAAAAAAAVTPGPLPTRYRTLTFSAGFLCGQASLIFVAVLFLRYVVFEDPKVALREAGKRKKKRLRSSASKRQRARPSTSAQLFNATATVPTSDSLLLQKVGYDLSSHSPESLDWLNVLLAQAVSAYRGMIVHAAEAQEKEGLLSDEEEEGETQARGAKGFVENAMNQGRSEGEGMITLDYITVTEFDFGQEYPILSNARVRPSNESGKVRIEVDMDYTDHVSLGIETKVCLNFPKPRFGIIPVNLALALVRFSATLTLEIPPPFASTSTSSSVTGAENTEATMSVSIHPDFILELASTSLIGSRAKLQDIPKVEQLIIGRIRGWVIENLVWPRVRTFKLPSVNRHRSAAAEADVEAEVVLSPEEDDGRSASASQMDDDDDDGRSGTSTRDGLGPRRRASSGSSSTIPLHAGVPMGGRAYPSIRVQTSSTQNLKQKAAQQPGSRHTAGGYATGIDPLEVGMSGMHHRPRRRSSLSSSVSMASTSVAHSPLGGGSTSSSSRQASPFDSASSGGGGGHGFGSSSVSLASSQSGRDRSESFTRFRTPLHSPGLGLGMRPGPGSASGSKTYASSRSQPITPTHPLSRTSSSLSISSLDSGTTASAMFDIGTPRWEQARKVYAERSSAKNNLSRRGSAQSSASSSGAGYFDASSPPFLSRRTSRVDEDPDGEDEQAREQVEREPDDSQFEIEELADV